LLQKMTQEEIQLELEQQQRLLQNYQELEVDMADDDAYVARGNGFCDAKYSEDFLESQITRILQRIETLKSMLEE